MKQSNKGSSMKQKILIIVLTTVVVLGIASGWIYNAVAGGNDSPVSQEELMNLQASFLAQYGTEAIATETIIPRIFEVAWADSSGNNNVSLNIGGIWVLISSVPKS